MKITLTNPVLRLSESAQRPRVSIYYSTHRGGPETRQDPIRLKNLLRQARERLTELGHGDHAEEILRPAWNLIPDLDFWRHQQEGLALLASANEFRYFHLPYDVPELTVAADDFYLKPLLPLFSREEHFYILGLSKNCVQLYEANRYSIRQISVPEVPESMAEALQFDDGELQLQERSFGPTTGPKGGLNNNQGAGMFHGHGGEKDVRDDELIRYFRTINRGLQHYLNGHRLPLMLAGVEYYFSLYRDANTYPHLLEHGVAAGLESMSEKELHEKAWPIAEPHLKQAQQKAIERFERIAYNKGSPNAARELEPAVVAAFEGRIDALLIPQEQEVWGEFDESTGEVKRESSDPSRRRELFDYAARETLLHGGEVFLVPREEMPSSSEVAALLRYSGGLLEREES